MAKALDVAKYYIQLAHSEDEPEQLSHLRIQKLVYYAQGWSLALRKTPLFKERIEAWTHGPVVAAMYHQFADYQSNLIPSDHFRLAKGALTEDERELIHSVWNAYKGFSALKLREMTHNEAPWKDAYGTCTPGEKCDAEITKSAMKQYFSHIAKDRV